jgi:uncharacterized protein YdeI (YjbR/CyaY-like superfamily)
VLADDQNPVAQREALVGVVGDGRVGRGVADRDARGDSDDGPADVLVRAIPHLDPEGEVARNVVKVRVGGFAQQFVDALVRLGRCTAERFVLRAQPKPAYQVDRTCNRMKNTPIKAFVSATQWRDWLARNCAKSDGIWLRIYKKGSGKKTVTYAEALDEALCYGWIDGQKKKYDAESFVQKFTPRRPKSIWSKRNREHIARLTKEKRMTAAGQKRVDAAKKDGRWDKAYDVGSTMEVPDDFLQELRKNARAYTFFKTLNRANTYAIAWRLQTAKTPETRARRMETLLAMMQQGKKLH